MKNLILLGLFLLVTSFISAQGLQSTGIIVGAGKGYISGNLIDKTSDGVLLDKANSSLKRKAVYDLGYRFRFATKSDRFFYDIDVLGSYSRVYSDCAFLSDDLNVNYVNASSYNDLLSVGIGGTFNYRIVKGLNVGIGMQPTLYVWDTAKKKFDAPVIGKIGYDFGFMELAFSYKQGLTKQYNFSNFKKCRMSSWQFSVYVPLTRSFKK